MFKKLFMDNSISIIKNYYPNYSKEKLEKIAYGLEGIYLTITKLAIIITVAIVINRLKELLLLLVFFNIIRHLAFGVHASKSYTCFIISSITLIGISIITPILIISISYKLIIGVLCISIYTIYAPADTSKRPLLNRHTRVKFKIGSIVVTMCYIALAFIINNNLIINSLLGSLALEGILILPITYKVMKQPYNNYKHY